MFLAHRHPDRFCCQWDGLEHSGKCRAFSTLDWESPWILKSDGRPPPSTPSLSYLRELYQGGAGGLFSTVRHRPGALPPHLGKSDPQRFNFLITNKPPDTHGTAISLAL